MPCTSFNPAATSGTIDSTTIRVVTGVPAVAEQMVIPLGLAPLQIFTPAAEQTPCPMVQPLPRSVQSAPLSMTPLQSLNKLTSDLPG